MTSAVLQTLRSHLKVAVGPLVEPGDQTAHVDVGYDDDDKPVEFLFARDGFDDLIGTIAWTDSQVMVSVAGQTRVDRVALRHPDADERLACAVIEVGKRYFKKKVPA